MEEPAVIGDIRPQDLRRLNDTCTREKSTDLSFCREGDIAAKDGQGFLVNFLACAEGAYVFIRWLLAAVHDQVQGNIEIVDLQADLHRKF